MKKAIVVVSFGTTYSDARQLNIESIENKMKATFPEYEVRRAFTSRMIIKRLAEREKLFIDNEQQALERLQAEGYEEVFIQPLHVVAGEEYDKVKKMVSHYAYRKTFGRIRIGRPLLYYMGQGGKVDDYQIAIEALAGQLPKVGQGEAVVLMGHGGLHPANAAYAALQMKLEQEGLDQVFVYGVEGFPELGSVITKLTKRQIKHVTLLPFLLVAGDHAKNDMAGDEKESAKSQLLRAGFTVDVQLQGLGANLGIQDIYVQHLKDAMATSAK